MSRKPLMDQITMVLGGHAAEDVALDDIYTGSSSDLKRATELCRRMVTEYGMSDELGTMYLAQRSGGIRGYGIRPEPRIQRAERRRHRRGCEEADWRPATSGPSPC